MRSVIPALRFGTALADKLGSRVQASSARLVEPDGGFSSRHLKLKSHPLGWLFNWGGVNRIILFSVHVDNRLF